MKVIHRAADLAPGSRAVCVAIGMFDGVHLGHQRILSQTVEEARSRNAVSLAVTFDRHPAAVLAPERTPLLISALPQKLREIERQGVDSTWLIHFDRAFSRQSGEAFILNLSRNVGRLQSVCIGRNFTFGYKRTGTVALLKVLGQQMGFAVRDLPAVSWEGRMISSTRIREALQLGALKEASAMLGRPYAVSGTVIRGERLGRKLGFPTANLNVAGLQMPPAGVYAGMAAIPSGRIAAVVNVGYRPTVARSSDLRFEVHLLDFEGDLYGQELEFEFGPRLRAEAKFHSLEELKQQIDRDVVEARSLLKPV